MQHLIVLDTEESNHTIVSLHIDDAQSAVFEALKHSRTLAAADAFAAQSLRSESLLFTSFLAGRLTHAIMRAAATWERI
jgi:hypothetical protein